MDDMREARWLAWAKELQFLAQAGLTYTKDPFDAERFQRIRDIAAEMVSAGSALPLETVKGLFCNEEGFQTPKIDTRAALFDEAGRILLVHENDGRWSLPGGWCDVLQSVARNAVKEVREEAGLDCEVERLVALHDWNRRNARASAWNVLKVILLCRPLGGAFHANIETTGSGWFTADALPPLAVEKNTPEQIALCFAAHADPNWRPPID